ncbi:MAG: hypothetical protein OEW29_17485, partial [Acidimicrobiia bacterium]|nr:hypothetical protein [Acidimicrobiia bacterium]
MALILAGGVVLAATGALDGEGDDSALDTGTGTVASVDAGLARWAELHGERYHRPPRPQPRPGRTTTTAARPAPALVT